MNRTLLRVYSPTAQSETDPMATLRVYCIMVLTFSAVEFI